MTAIKFIVALPTFNRPQLLERAINSIRSQNYSHFKVLIVDDSGEPAQKITAHEIDSDKLHVYFHSSNLGVNQARNTIVIEANKLDPEAYIVFMDDDDYLVDGALINAASAIKENPGYIWYTMDCIHPNGRPISKLKQYGKLSYLHDYMFGKKMRGDMMHIVKAEAITDIRFSDRFKNGEIWYFWCKLAAKNNLYAIPSVGKVCEYLEGGITKSGFNRKNIISVLQYKIATLEPMVGAKKLRHQYVSLAKYLLKEQRKTEAKELLDVVLRSSPGYFRQYKYWIRYYLL